MVHLQTNNTNNIIDTQILTNSSQANNEATTDTNQPVDIQDNNNSTNPVVNNNIKYLLEDYFSKRQHNSGNDPNTTTVTSSQATTTNQQLQENTTNTTDHSISNVCNSDQLIIDNNANTKNPISNTNTTLLNSVNSIDVDESSFDILSIDPDDSIMNENKSNNLSQTSLHRTTVRQTTIQQETRTTEGWGGSINSKENKTFRIYFQNLNSIRVIDEFGGKWNRALKYMKDSNCEIFGFAETCINWKHDMTRKQLNKYAQQNFGFTTKMIHSKNKFQLNNNSSTILKSNYQPGGTIQMLTDHWSSRLIEEFQDPRQMGRWCGQKVRTNNNTTLTIITAYRPCRHQSNGSSTSKATSTQQTIMLKEQDIYHDPRKVFLNDLIELINQQENITNNHVIVMIDANESLEEKPGDIQRLIRETTLIDVFTHHTGEVCSIPTYTSGSKRIDYIFATYKTLRYVKNVGYLNFYEDKIGTDHRGCFIDLSEDMIDDKVLLTRPEKRLIGSKSDIDDIFKYKKNLNDKFIHHKIYEKSEQIYQEAIINGYNEDIDLKKFRKKLNQLDSIITECMLQCEKQLGKRYHDTDWSIAIHNCSIECHYWRTRLKGKTNNINVDEQANAVIKDLPIETIEIIKSKHNNNIEKEYRKILATRKELMKHSTALRIEGMEKLAEIREREGNKGRAKIIMKISHAEDRKRDWDKLNATYNPEQRSSVTCVEIPSKDDEGNYTTDVDKAKTWSTITQPKAVEKVIIDRNIKHFGQAEGSPFTQELLQELLGYDGVSTAIEELLNGNIEQINLTTFNPGTTQIFERLAAKRKLNDVNDDITYEEWCNGIRKWSEKTTTSPSGRHLGHYKALLKDDSLNINYNETYKDPAHNIMKVYYEISVAALQTGTSLNRWQDVITTMIPKISGCNKINKLRAIHIFEADFNLMLKILWSRKMVWNALGNRMLNSGQAGSRPGCNAIDIVIMKEMKYLYSMITRTGLATMDNDAKSCFDRIICNLAMMISRFFGMTKRACKMHGMTLKKMRYRLRTALGISKQEYTNTKSFPLHGTGQGSCVSPAIWLTISSILMDCLSEIAGGMKMQDITNDNQLIDWINGFVDDTSLFSNIGKSNDVQAIVKQLKHDMITWQQLLEASGGKLELSKCFFYILTWSFDKEGNPTPQTMKQQYSITPTNIEIVDTTTGKQISIKQQELTKAHKTLGCMKTMLGEETSQTQFLKAKADIYAAQTKNTTLSRRQARTAYNTMYIPSLKYSLPACSMNENQINDVQNYAVEKFLSAMGYDNHFPRAMAFGHQDFGGLNLSHLFSEMHGMKIDSILSNIRKETALGKAFIINLNNLQLLAGTQECLLESTVNISYVGKNWLTHLRDFIIEIGGKIIIPKLWHPEYQRENDITIMQAFMKIGLSQKQMRLANNWRVHYQVNYVSELCNPTGDKIQQLFLTQQHNINDKMNKSKLNWAMQGTPGDKGFQIWLQSLKQFLGINMKTRQITYKLGKWFPDIHLKYNQWNSYYDQTSFISSTFNGNNYDSWKSSINRTGRATHFNDESYIWNQENVSSSSIPAEVNSNRTSKVTTFFKQSSPTNQAKTTKKITTFKQYVDKLPDWKQDCMRFVNIPKKNILRDMLIGSEYLTIVTDGGALTTCNTFGGVITNGEHKIVDFNGKIYFNPNTSSSYRSESYGMLSGIMILEALVDYYDIDIGKKKIRLVSDCKPLIQRINQRSRRYMSTNQHIDSDVDIELQILYELKQLRKKHEVTVHYVKGHQDSVKSSAKLSHDELMNVHANKLCKEARLLNEPLSYHMFPQNNATFFINNIPINSEYAKYAKKYYHSMCTRHFFKKKYQWNDHTIDSIWWNIHAKALKSLEANDRIRIQKFIHNRLPTNKRQKAYYHHKSDICNNCFNYSETEDHIIKCRTTSRKDIRTNWIAETTTYLEQKYTPIEVKDAIVKGLTKWLEPSEEETVDETIIKPNKYVQAAITAQHNIGWEHFMRGRITMQWGDLINHHLKNSKIQPEEMDAEQWGAKLININFKYILELWNLRNEEVFGTTPDQIEKNKVIRCLEEVKYIQEMNQDCKASDRDWLLEDLEELSKQNSKKLEIWLHGARILAKNNKKNRCSGTNCKKISDFYQYSTCPVLLITPEFDPGEVYPPESEA